MVFQNIDAFQRHFEQMLERAEELHALAKAQGNEAAAGLIRQQWFRLRQGPVRALVLGVSSAGKSTLINAMAGQIVVPEGKQTTSPIPVWVYRDDTPPDNPRIRLLKKDDITPLNCGRFSYLTDYCYTAAEAGRGTGQEKYRDLEAAVVDVNAPALETAGVTLIDTPGIGVSRGDNARVQDVLADGCEILVILFMNLQQQEVKEYFSELLARDDAPLGDLLDQGRVFLVLNATDELHADPYAEMDTRAHIQDAFYGWDGEDRLFVFNALEARLKACGVYGYRDLLPEGYSEEEMAHAAATEALEQERLAAARPQEDLARLCDAMGMAVQEICDSDEAVNRILEPIEAGLNEALTLLKQPYLDRLRHIRETEYPVPQALADGCSHLEQQLKTIEGRLRETKALLSADSRESESRWPIQRQTAEYSRLAEFANYQLMDDSRDQADAWLVERIRQENGAEQWLRLLERRLGDIHGKLLGRLSSHTQNAELEYWHETANQMISGAEGLTDHNGIALITREQIDSLRQRLEFALNQAEQAGEKALRGAGVAEMTAEEKEKVRTYFREKQERVSAGGLLQGVRLFVLYPDAAVEILTPLMKRVIGEGTAAYMEAYRQKLWGFMPMLQTQYQGMLSEANVKAGLLLEELRKEIPQAQERARQADLDRVREEMERLTQYGPDQKE